MKRLASILALCLFVCGTLSADITAQMRAVAAKRGFAPLALTPDIWLDASQETFANNDPVGTFTDRSGNGRNHTEASAKPTFKTGILNGKPGIYFDGGDQLLLSYSGSGTSYTIAGLVSRDDDAFRIWWANGIDPYVGINSGRIPYFYQGAVVSSGLSAFPGSVDEPQLMGVRSVAGTTQLIVGRNIYRTGSSTASALKTSGLSSLGGFQWKGYIHEVVAKSAALSFADWNNLESYIRAKWATTNRHILVLDGDSITYGSGGSDLAHSWGGLLAASLGATNWQVSNQGIVGQTIGNRTGSGGPAEYMLLNAATAEWTCGTRTDGSNALIAFAGTNDLFFGATATQAYDAFVAYCQGAQAGGHKVIASTMLDRAVSGSWTRADMLTFNSNVRTNWATFADALVDPITADSRFDDNTSAVFADGTHPNDTGHAVLHGLFSAALTAIGF